MKQSCLIMPQMGNFYFQRISSVVIKNNHTGTVQFWQIYDPQYTQLVFPYSTPYKFSTAQS